jgi:hypothetical protein
MNLKMKMMNKRITLFLWLSCVGIHAQNQITNVGNLQFHPGATVSIRGNFENDGSFVDSGTVVVFNGNSSQVISGTSAINFRNGEVNNINGVNLQRSIGIVNNITLTTGSVFLNTNSLTVMNGNTNAIIRTAGNIVSEQTDNSGKLIWIIGSTTGAHIFPFATASGQYIPFTMDLTAGTIGTVTLATYPTVPNNLPYPSSPDVVTHVNNGLGMDNSANTVDRFWQIDKSGIDGTATVTFTATSSEVGSIGNLSAYRWDNVSQGWQTPGGTQTNTANSVTVQNLTTFSPWTLAGNGAPLPVELLDFTAVLNIDHQVNLDWTTVSEINNDYFIIEKTKDGIEFEFVGEIDGAGNSNMELNYHLLDIDPYTGQSYYRLKQTDFDGEVKYTDLRSIYIGNSSEFSWSLYPNPNDGHFSVIITGLNNKEIVLNVMDITGKLVYTKPIFVEAAQQMISIDQMGILAVGIYTVQLITGNESYASKMIVH